MSGSSGGPPRSLVDKLHVVIVDDHTLLAESLALSLEAQDITCSVPALDEVDDLVEHVIGEAPDLVLLDLDLGPLGDGSVLVRPLAAASLRVLIVSAARDLEAVAAAVADGAVGLVPKDQSFADLVATVAAAARGHEVMGPAERLRHVDAARRRRQSREEVLAPFRALSEGEAAVLRALADGESVAVIADRRVVSTATVRSQVRAVLTKLGVGSQLEAVALAHRAGWC